MHAAFALPSSFLPASPSESDGDAQVRAVAARFEKPLLSFAARLTGDLELARDVVQDTFVRFSRHAPSAFDGGDPAKWLFTVCRNRALDLCRRAGRVTFVEQEQLESEPSPALAPDEAAAAEDEHALLRRLLTQLPARQQELVQLKFQQDLSYRDIAAITGLSETNVGFLLHTALKKLRALRLAFEPRA